MSGEPFGVAAPLRRPELMRIEAAFAAGMARAKCAEAELLCHRLRNAGLAALVDKSYQAALAWLIDHPDYAEALGGDQARWQDGMAEAMAVGGDAAALEAIAARLLERLRLLDRLTSRNFIGSFSAEFTATYRAKRQPLFGEQDAVIGADQADAERNQQHGRHVALILVRGVSPKHGRAPLHGGAERRGCIWTRLMI